MEALKKLAEAIETYVRPSTYPVVFKMLSSETDIPQGIERVQKALGHELLLCQAAGLARRNAMSLVMMKDDIGCPIAIMSLGLAEPPEYWLKGNLYLDWYTPNPQAAEKIAREMDRFPVGKYVGVVVAPIHTCNFEPDVVMIYCNPEKLLRLIQAALNQEGGRFPASFWLPGACTSWITPTMQTGKCQFSIPCYGDRIYEGTSDDEVVFTIPSTRLEEIASGLKFFHDHGHGLVTQRAVDFKPVMRDTYKEILNML